MKNGNNESVFMYVDMAFNDIVNEISRAGRDIEIMLPDSAALSLLHNLNMLSADLRNKCNTGNLLHVLGLRKRRFLYENVCERIKIIFKNTINFFGVCCCNGASDYIEDKDKALCHDFPEIYKDFMNGQRSKYLNEICELTREGTNEDNYYYMYKFFEEQNLYGAKLHDATEKLYAIFAMLVEYGRSVYEGLYIDDDELHELTVRELKAFCSIQRKTDLSRLKNMAKEFKPTPSKRLTPEEWGKVMKQEENSIKKMANELAMPIQGMINPNRIYQLYVDCCNEEDLFDLDYAYDRGLYDMLTEDNFIQFFDMVLRYNLILCEMSPDLKPQFEAWLNDEEPAEPSVSETEDKGPLFTPQAMALWGKLQKAGLVDEKLQPKVSMRKASIIAAIMGELLDITPLWAPFEELWNTKKLDNSYSQAKLQKYFSTFYKDTRKTLSNK